MDVNKLVRMANQIATNFDYGSDRNKSADAVCDHISRFWNSSMKDQIIQYQRSGETGLSELASLAIARLAEKESDAA